MSVHLFTVCNFGYRGCPPGARRWAEDSGPVAVGTGPCEKVVKSRTGDVLNPAGLKTARNPFSPVLTSLMSDPFPPEETKARVTREAIATLHEHGVGVRLLTRFGMRDGGLVKNPAGTVVNQKLTTRTGLSARFGLKPGDRAHIGRDRFEPEHNVAMEIALEAAEARREIAQRNARQGPDCTERR